MIDMNYIITGGTGFIGTHLANLIKEQDKVEYIGSGNVGYGAGHNQALRKIVGTAIKYHLVLNSDVYFSPDVIDKLAEYMDKNEDVAQVQPKIPSRLVSM